MSWAIEEWKEGLPSKALQKIQDFESQLEKLKKERQQKQFQLESLEAAFQKQKQKVENEKSEVTALKRENQSLVESCDNLEKSKQKISHDLQVKELQVNFLEGQLATCKKQIEKLEQEMKRSKCEIERSQQPLLLGDLQPCATPEKNFAVPVAPSRNYNDSKVEELQEKYNKEVEERKRLEAELKIMQAKVVNQSQGNVNRRDIARQQASSSVFPWQQEQTPSHAASNSLETPSRRGCTTSHFPWEREETPSMYCQRSAKKTASNSSFNESSSNSPQNDLLKVQNQELNSKVTELELRLQAQEKEMKTCANKLQEVQAHFEKAKLELSEKDKALNKYRDEVTKMTTQLDQSSSKCEVVEQKLKQVSEELICQRQNTDSARHTMEQRLKEKEKEYQQELCQQLHSFQILDQQFKQMKTELQQAKNDRNTLQAEIDKLSTMKQRAEKEVEDMKQTLFRTEQTLQAKEKDFKKTVEEVQKEKNNLHCQFEQSSRQVHQQEEELKMTQQHLKQSQSLVEELKSKNIAREVQLLSFKEKLDKQEQSLNTDLENLRQTVADLQKQQDSAQDILTKREKEMEEMNNKIITMEKETEELQNALCLKYNECAELKRETSLLSEWKNKTENLKNQMLCEKEGMLKEIQELEKCLESHQYDNERIKVLENEKQNLCLQIENYERLLDCKSADLESQKQIYEKLRKTAEQADQKYSKEKENMCLQVIQLTAQANGLEKKLQLETNKILKMEQSYSELCAEYERATNLAKSKESVIELKEAEMLNLQNSLSETIIDFEKQLAKVNSEKSDLIKEHENAVLGKAVEAENMKLELEKCQNDIAFSKEQISSLECDLKLQKDLNSELESRCEELMKVKDELEEKLVEVAKNLEIVQAEAKEERELKITVSAQQQRVDDLLATVQEKEMSIQKLTSEQERKESCLQSLQSSNQLLEVQVQQLNIQSEAQRQEKEDILASIFSNEKEVENLAKENEKLKEVIDTLSQEKQVLLEKNSNFANMVKEKEAEVSELSTRRAEEHQTILENNVKLESELANLQKKYSCMEETKDELEVQIKEKTEKLEEQERKFNKQCAEYLSKMEHYEEANQSLVKEVEKVQSSLNNKLEETTQFKERLIVSEKETENLRKKLSDTTEGYKELQEMLRRLQQENELLNQQVTEERKKLSCLRNAFNENETVFAKKNKDACLKIDQLEKELSTAQNQQLKSSELAKEKTQYGEELREAMREKESDLSKIQVQLEMLQMDLEDKEVCIESYSTQIEQMEATVKKMESELRESEEQKTIVREEKNSLCKELEATKSKLSDALEKEQILKLCAEHKEQSEKELAAVSQEYKSCQLLKTKLETSLQEVSSKCEELEKMYERMQTEKSELISELSNLRTQCTTVLDENSGLADKIKHLENEVNLSKDESTALHSKLMSLKDENEKLKEWAKQEECEKLKLCNKEIERHLFEVNEKLSCSQKEYDIVQEQYCCAMSKVSELQSLVETLEEEKSVLVAKLEEVYSSKMDAPEFSDRIEPKQTCAIFEHESPIHIKEDNAHENPVNIKEDPAVSKHHIAAEGTDHFNQSAEVDKADELQTQLNMAERKLFDTEIILSKTNVEKAALEAEVNILETSLESAQLQLTEQKAQLQHLEQLILERETEVMDLKEQLNDFKGNLVSKENNASQTEGNLPKEIEELKILSETYETGIKKLEEQLQMQKDARNGEIQELSQTLAATKNELTCLQKQHSSEIDQWQQKLSSMTLEMETKLAAERQQTEILSTELKGARIQIQHLDLSSHSLLCAETEEVQNGSCIQDQKEEINENLQYINSFSKDPQSEPQSNERDGIETENTIDISQENISRLDVETETDSVADNTVECLRATVEFLCLDSNTSTHQEDFQETHVVPESCTSQPENVSSKQEFLSQELEEYKKDDILLKEEQHLYSRLDSQQLQSTSQNSACTELQNVVYKLEEEKSVLSDRIKSTNLENQKLSERIKDLEKELNSMTSEQEVYKARLSDVTEMLHSLEMVKGNWNEKYLEVENELKRTRSEKANLEKHILSMEADIEEMQIAKTSLEKEAANSSKCISRLGEQLSVATADKNQLSQELESSREIQEELEQISQNLKEKLEQLASDKVNYTEFIKVLEAENKKLTKQLEITKFDVEKLSKERNSILEQLDCLEKNVLSDEKGELQKQFDQRTEEKEVLLNECETLQGKICALEMENSRLSQSLESSLVEKGEIASRLNSTQEEVVQMRHGIEKLKVRIESDEKKRHHEAEKLKASERKADSFQDKVEKLQRELQMSEESLEGMVLEAETVKEEMEKLVTVKQEISKKLQILETEVNTLSSERDLLDKELQQKQLKISELEGSCMDITNLLKKVEEEKLQVMQEHVVSQKALKSELMELNEKLKICSEELENWRAKEQDWLGQISGLECEKTELSQQLQQKESSFAELHSANVSLTQDLLASKQELNEQVKANNRLQQEVTDMQQWKQKISEQLSNVEAEKVSLEKERNQLQTITTESEQRVQALEAKNFKMQGTIEGLEGSQQLLEDELQSAKLQNSALLEQIQKITENDSRVRSDLNAANQKIEKMQEECNLERSTLVAQINNAQQQEESYKVQLDLVTSEKEEMKKRLQHLQNELQISEEKIKEERMEYQHQLQEAEEKQKTLLKEGREKEAEVHTEREKLITMRQMLNDHILEINNLKSAKEQLNAALRKAESKLEQLNEKKVEDLKTTIVQLKKEKESAVSKLQLWMRSCKQMEQEKEMLLKDIEQQDALLNKLKKNEKIETDTNADGVSSELEELRETVEEKTREADESMEKYCNLIINYHKLEEANETLKNRIAFLSSQLKQPGSQDSNSTAKTTPDNPPNSKTGNLKTGKTSPWDRSRPCNKRHRTVEPKEDGLELEKVEATECVSKRIRNGKENGMSRHSAGGDNVEFKPEGLPEVVKKGFADIPAGTASPFILRRTTLQRRSPRLAAQKTSPITQVVQKVALENQAQNSKTPGGSKLQQVKEVSSFSLGSVLGPVASTSGSPLSSVINSPKKTAFQIPSGSAPTRRSRRSPSTRKYPEQEEEEENCNVQ
ncbi:centromere protein F [Latimeria chalumnae]|uniref:Centromere protein F n=1 Tax=Latimeria chalumnae TaxID=7897 RepID=M3XII8_LATCH|nr:PREDICTED: centromere protein F [Latimeria chalumnae]|eukprot:XP_014345462.1 PREDICTED: centromere protein F [Latimeria chalumnae]